MLHFAVLSVFLIFHPGRIECSLNSESFVHASDPGNDSCPPWFIYNETTSKCQCGNDLGGIVKCNDKEGAQENAIMECYCMTHDEKSEKSGIVPDVPGQLGTMYPLLYRDVFICGG